MQATTRMMSKATLRVAGCICTVISVIDEFVDFFDFGFVAVVVGGEVVGDLLLEVGIEDEVGKAAGAAFVVEGNDDAVDAVADLARCRWIVGYGHRLAEHLCFTNCNRLALVARGLHVDVASLDVRVRIVALAQEDYVLFHTGFGYLSTNQRFVAAVADDVPSEREIGRVDAATAVNAGEYSPANIGHVVVVFRFGEATY